MTDVKVPVVKILEASKGMAQKQLYVILTTPVQGLEPVLKNLDEHLKFQVDLERRGIMFCAGPFWDDDETHWSGDGMVIIRAESLAAARAIAAEDPMHKSGARRFTVRPWLLNEGTLTLHLNFSDMTTRLQ
jgi:uncharacterized protein YciI